MPARGEAGARAVFSELLQQLAFSFEAERFGERSDRDLEELQKQEQPATAQQAGERKMTATIPLHIVVPSVLEQPHPFVAAAASRLRNATVDRDGLVSSDDALRLRVSPSQVERALLIVDTLIKAVERVGHKFDMAETIEGRACFFIRGVEVYFRLHERLLQRPHVPTDNEARTGLKVRKVDLRPKGRLRLKVDGGYPKWQDSPKRRLEDRMDEIVAGVLNRAIERKAYAVRCAELDRLDAEAERERLARAQHELERRQQRYDLLAQAEKWRDAKSLRSLIKAVRTEALHRFGAIQPGSPADKWLRSATAVADDLDPMDSILGRGEKRRT